MNTQNQQPMNQQPMNQQAGTNQAEVPQAKNALYNMKFEVANQLGVNLKKGYNGDLTAKQNGSVGGEMVRQMIAQQEQQMSGK